MTLEKQRLNADRHEENNSGEVQRRFRDKQIQAGLRIDPETAEVLWTYTKIGDPYEFSAVMPWEAIGRTYWACSLDEQIWVPFDDLPWATAKALWDKHRSKLERPKGCAPEDDHVSWEDRCTEGQKSFLQTREEAGLRIDLQTAEVMWTYARVGDPYGLFPPTWDSCVGREYWARTPGSDIWVCFDDLPQAIMEALLARHSSKLDFPAGLEWALGAQPTPIRPA